MGSPFLVPVAALIRDIPSSTTVAFSAPFDPQHEVEARPAGEGEVPEGAEVEVALTIASFSGGLRATGSVRCPWVGRCRRCSKDIGGLIDAPVVELLKNDRSASDEAYLYHGDVVDLSPLVHDAIFLELPIVPLCSEDCRGLCAQCGTDLNEATCDCTAPVDPRWAKLSELTFDENSSESPE